jgi:hypothetical protein
MHAAHETNGPTGGYEEKTPVKRAKTRILNGRKNSIFKPGRTWFAVSHGQPVPHKRGTNGEEICCQSLFHLKQHKFNQKYIR